MQVRSERVSSPTAGSRPRMLAMSSLSITPHGELLCHDEPETANAIEIRLDLPEHLRTSLT